MAQVAHHKSNIVLEGLTERAWCTKFQSSPMNIYFRLSGFQASFLFIYFRDGPNRCSYCTNVSLWHPIWYGFRGGAKAIRYSLNRGAFIEGECEGVEVEVGKKENWGFFFLALASLAYSPNSSKKQCIGQVDSPTWKMKLSTIKETTNKKIQTTIPWVLNKHYLWIAKPVYLINTRIQTIRGKYHVTPAGNDLGT